MRACPRFAPGYDELERGGRSPPNPSGEDHEEEHR